MFFYLASRYSRRVELLGYKKLLEADGHMVTSRWLSGEYELPGPDPMGPPGEEGDVIRRSWAEVDLHDMDTADAFVLFNDRPEDHAKKMSGGGCHAEFGWALATGHTLFIVGARTTPLHYVTRVRHFETPEQFLSHVAGGFR